MHTSADASRADQATTDRAKVLVPFGLTERQACFLVTVMLHSGVFAGRQYAAFAGITHGQKVHDFIQKLVARKFVTPIELGSTGRTKIFHVHHKPLYAAIGEPDNRNRRRVGIDRAIERLMLLDGVRADQSVTWLGSEREKRRYFKQRLGDRLRDDEYPRLVFGKKPNITVRYFPDKLPIGYEPDQYGHVFIYLVGNRSPMDFRVFILRHLELLNALGFWTIRVLFPRSLAASMDAYWNAAHELLAKPLSLSQTEELTWFLRQPEAPAHDASPADQVRLHAARKAFRGPRFAAIRRHSLAEGNRAVFLAASPVGRDTLERRRAICCPQSWRRSFSAEDWGVSDPRFSPSDFAPSADARVAHAPAVHPSVASGPVNVYRRPRRPQDCLAVLRLAHLLRETNLSVVRLTRIPVWLQR